ncbi:MAG: glycosyltransferase family 4 protein [Verrucomicrobiota bacterium]
MEISIFHEFVPPPCGGGHQFLYALKRVMEARGIRVVNNVITSDTNACLFNSFNFDFELLQRQARQGVKMVHRVDGPVGVYRGYDDGTDERVHQINQQLADETILQSEFSKQCHSELGMAYKSPWVILNASDPEIFRAPKIKVDWFWKKKRVLAASWSDNPRKGGPFYAELAGKLDFSRYEMTFVGRSSCEIPGVKTMGPVDSHALSKMMRQHDVFITASHDDPCSNTVIEAMTCGLPVLYLKSGGHPELVGEAGEAFLDIDEALSGLDRVAANIDEYRERLNPPRLNEIVDAYLEVLLA